MAGENRIADADFVRKFNRTRCPICNSIEGCDHTVNERLRALEDTEFRGRMRAEDPLYRPQPVQP